MTHRRFLLVAVAILSPWSAAFGQIVGPDTAPAHTVVSLKIDQEFPTGSKAKYRWTGSPGLSIGEGSEDNKTAYVTGAPATYTPSATVAWLDGETLKLEAWTHTLTIGDAPPGPPGPVVKTLAQLAGPVDSPKLGTLYAALAPQVVDVTSAASFKAVHAKLLADQGLTGNGAAAEIDKRLAPALEPFDAGKLQGVLEAFVAELGSLPPPPVVVEGKRQLVIIHETADTTPADAAVFTALRTGPFEAYRKSKSQPSPLILDDDAEDQGGNPIPLVETLEATGVALPAMFVIEPTTKAIIAKQPLAATDEEVLAFYQANGG